jgi:transposase InsO family protein
MPLFDSADLLIAKIRNLFNRDLALQNDYLRQENKILRSKLGKRVPLNETEHRVLVKYALPIKDRLHEIMGIVRPETLLSWHRRMKRKKWTFEHKKFKKPGRPQKPEQTEKLVIQLAEENTWGYRRIAGEMKKLGHELCPGTVRNILIRNGLPPAPQRKGMSWKRFIQSHLDVAWAADFFTEEVWTMGGLVTFYTLFLIHLKTRRVHIAGCTANPDSAWVKQQARNFSMRLADVDEKCRYVIHDRDASFAGFDFILKAQGIKIVKTPPKTPMCNAFAERFVREARQTLNQIIPLGRWHFLHVVKCIKQHHNKERPHQGIGNRIPLGYKYPATPVGTSQIGCKSLLGGLLNHYYKKAA